MSGSPDDGNTSPSLLAKVTLIIEGDDGETQTFVAERAHEIELGLKTPVEPGDDSDDRPRSVTVSAPRSSRVEADPHDADVRDHFEEMWSPIDAEHELRTEPWAPPGSASEEALDQALNNFTEWVTASLAADSTTEHK